MVTAYDACFGSIAEDAGVDIILVGDSLANVVLGKKSTREIGTDIMALFVEAVVNGTSNTHITVDMPYNSYTDPKVGIENAKRFMDLGAHSVKIEGDDLSVIEAILNKGIPVMGHLGVLPQTATSLKKVGFEAVEQQATLEIAKRLDDMGIFSLVLEHMSFDLAETITEAISVPTIGIGAGPRVNGQVLVLHDVLGLGTKKIPPFAKKFINLRNLALKGLLDFKEAVQNRNFPETP